MTRSLEDLFRAPAPPKPRRKPRPRDYQRSKVYRAEREAGLVTYDDPPPELETVESCEEFVRRIVATDAWRKLGGWHGRIVVRPGFGATSARGGGRGGGVQLTLPRWARKPAVILHELAHALTYHQRSAAGATGRRFAAHGREFCANYLALVRLRLGPAAEAKLRAAFRANRVRFRGRDEDHYRKIEARAARPATAVDPAVRARMAALAARMKPR